MTTMNDIVLFSKDIARLIKPKRIILFGSYARGTARKDSDVDLLVSTTETLNGPDTASKIIEHINPKFAVDIIVRSESDIQLRLKENDFFLQQAIREGQLLYEEAHA
jgi:uncharacterized protein